MSTAFASVEDHLNCGMNYEMSYPIVYTNDKAAQDKINQDIYHYIATFRDDFQAGKFYKGKFSYDVKFENDKYISLTVIDDRIDSPRSGGRNHYKLYGVVYDKKTGNKLPLSHFLKITLEDLSWLCITNLYNDSGYNLENTYKKPDQISEDYYLMGNGGIALIYQTWRLSVYSDGATTIRLSAEEVNYFNRKNRNL